MEILVWMLFLCGITLYLMRKLLAWNAMPVSRPAIRQLLLQCLQASLTDSVHAGTQEDELSLQVGGQTCTIHLDQLYRRCAETPRQTGAYIRLAAHAILRALTDEDRLPAEWERLLAPLLLRQDAPTPPDLVTHPIVDTLRIGYALVMPDGFRWMTRAMLRDTGLTEEALHALALRNLERSCNALVIDTPNRQSDEHERIIRFITGDGLDATRLLLPSLYQRFSPRFGDDDLLVAIPCRDALEMVSRRDQSLAKLLSWHCARENTQRAYSLATRLFLVTETGGITPWKERRKDEG